MILLILLPLVFGDVYMHNPRGNNDRNCERNVNRNNGNRQFDSQNNAKGGYACPRAVSGTNAAIPPKGLTPNMVYEEGSLLELEWTAQHGCGYKRDDQTTPTDPSVHCEMTVQMLCAQTSDPTGQYGTMFQGTAQQYQAVPREGIPANDGDAATNRIGTNDPGQAAGAANGQNLRFGVHETPQYYNACNRRERNRGLFTADQKVNRRSAIGTRQNPNGGRRGLECPEERDYYPYWGPTPFIDVAYLVDDPERCGQAGAAASAMLTTSAMCGGPGATPQQRCGAANAAAEIGKGDWVGNVQGYLDTAKAPGMNWNGQCGLKAGVGPAADVGKIPKTNTGLGNAAARLFNRREWPSNPADCATIAEAAEWIETPFTRGFSLTATKNAAVKNLAGAGPQCGVLDWSRANHLGNNGKDTASRYTMTIPVVNSANAADFTVTGKGEPCILRLRYNMSSSDYLRATNASSNQKNANGGQPAVQSPIRQDPLVKIGPLATDYVQLALNTNQVARTFQDRSYIFMVKPAAPANLNMKVLNVNVRGKRGNIVQCYPAVEYDLIPNEIMIAENERATTKLIFQHIGTDYNPRRGCNDAEGGPYVGDANVATGLTANTQGSNQNSRMDRMTLQYTRDNIRNYPDLENTGTGALLGVKQTNGVGIFNDDAQARAFAYAKCDTMLQMTTGNGVYPQLVPRALTPLTGDEIDDINNENRRENHPRNCGEGNAISPYFSPEEITLNGHPPGTATLFSARNNNFSNRETKVTIVIGAATAGGGIAAPAPFQASNQITKVVEYADPESANYTLALSSDSPPFDPVENDDYGTGAKEGCTQEMLFTAGAVTYTPVFVMFLTFFGLFF